MNDDKKALAEGFRRICAEMRAKRMAEADAVANAKAMADNQGKPANTLNGVSFAELMRMLRGEA